MSFNPYEILNLSKTCTQDEIKTAFKLASLKYHPDRPNGGDAVKFNLCVKAKDLLLDVTTRHVYDRGGHEAVQAYEERNKSLNVKKCPNFEIEVEISLEDVYKENTITIDRDLPENGKFNLELKLNSKMINQRICVQNQGITHEDFITGDVIISFRLNSEFKVNNDDLILDVHIPYLDLLNFTINIAHPSGEKYYIKSTFENPDEHGNMVLYYPGLGINSTGKLIVCVTPDLKNLKTLKDKISQSFKDTFKDEFKFNIKEEGQNITQRHTKLMHPREMFPRQMGQMGQMQMGQAVQCPVQ
jgi:DnaJ-class molecular chaperone